MDFIITPNDLKGKNAEMTELIKSIRQEERDRLTKILFLEKNKRKEREGIISLKNTILNSISQRMSPYLNEVLEWDAKRIIESLKEENGKLALKILDLKSKQFIIIQNCY